MKERARERLKERIAPGLWVDTDNALHISITELLEAHGFEDTPENREICLKAARGVLAQHAPGSTVIFREHPESKGERVQ